MPSASAFKPAKLEPVTGTVRTGAAVKRSKWNKGALHEVDYTNRVFSVNV